MSTTDAKEVHDMLRQDIENTRLSMKEDYDRYHNEMKTIHDDFSLQIKELRTLISPMIETYSAALRIGKWTSKTIVFISVLVGVFYSIIDLFKKNK